MYQVRPMVVEDIPQVAAIEREAFPEQRPGTPLQRELENRLARYLVLCGGGEKGEPVVGYAGLWFPVDEAHLLSLAVRADYRRLGLGELLLIACLDLATGRAAPLMTLEVRVSNLPAQGLYEKYGFVQVGRRRGYYANNNEDAFLMTVEGLGSEAYQVRLRALKEAYTRRYGPYQVTLPQ